MDYSHYMFLRKEVDLDKMMAKEDARLSQKFYLSFVEQYKYVTF